MIVESFSLFLLGIYFHTSINISIVLISIIYTCTIITPYLFAKITNIVANDKKIQTFFELFILWFGGGVFYLFIYYFTNYFVTFSLIGLSILLGVILQLKFEYKKISYSNIQLLPFKYSSIANKDVIGIFSLLALFWIATTLTIKKFSFYLTGIGFLKIENFFLSFYLFLLINIVVSLFFFYLNRRVNLRILYYVDYLLISISVVIILFWKEFLPISFILVSSFGITTFAFSMPDLMDINKGNVGLSFMSFFHILLLFFPIIHITIFIVDNSLTDLFVSFSLIIIIIGMALISGIKFLPLPEKVEFIIISHKNGIPLFTRGPASNSEKIISGLLTGIITILSASSSTDTIKTIDHGDKKIIISFSNRLFGVIICDRKSKIIGYKLQEIVDLFEVGFDKILDLNTFNLQLFKKLPPLLAKKIDILLSDTNS